MGAFKDSTVQRRVSPRLRNVPEEKKPFYGSPCRKRASDDTIDDTVCSKKPNVPKPSAPAQKGSPNSGKEKEKVEVQAQKGESETRALGVEHFNLSWYAPTVPLFDDNGVSFTARLKETLRLFNLHYLHFVQEEEKRCRKLENGSAGCDDLKRPSKRPNLKANSENGNLKCKSRRPDLKAITEMLTNDEILHPEKTIGHLPGVPVGHQFFSRAEMVAVGFHGHWLNGIDYVGKCKGKAKYKGCTLPFAIAIVLSGQYEDDVDNSDEVVYTGQGGNDLLGNKRQIKDQVMSRGNLALKNNMEQSIPVRVIRGHACFTSYTKKVYTYDGLYKVIEYWAEKGVAGFTVFKYRLKRLTGQPKLLSNQVHFTRGKGSKAQSELPGLVCKDICNGLENICIPATNIVDVPRVAPEGLSYINSIEVAKDVVIPPSAPGCSCKGTCNDPRTCSCAQLNGSDFPYVERDGGRLIEAKAVVFECGPRCGCGPDCVNRTSQRGLKYRLEVYRTPEKGWAVRSWDYIPSGAPVCEYIGVLRRSDELDSVSENDYIFEIDCWQTMQGIGGREKRLCDVTIPNSDAEKGFSKLSESEPEFCLDAGTRGNVARYINHSCEPNLFVQCVLSSHHDVRLARIVLFAADNIPPLQELTYDYGYELDSVVGPDGKVKKLDCHCGADGCRKRLF